MIASTHTSNDLNSRTMGRKLVVSGSLRRPAPQAPTEGSCLLRGKCFHQHTTNIFCIQNLQGYAQRNYTEFKGLENKRLPT